MAEVGPVAHDAATPWWVVAAAAVPSVASGLWVFWRWWVDRGDARAAVLLTREQTVLHDLELQRAALGKDQAELFDRIRTELVRCQLRLTELERDRDRAWDLARWWNRRAHELRHAGVNAQQVAQRLAVSSCPMPGGQPLPPWPDMTIPGLEEP